ncbi:hypothetical protein Emag_000592 [Eimeria magna]
MSIWLECGLAAASDWEESPAGSTKYLGVEAVGDEIPPSHHLPVELSEEQFFLVDWASNVTRPRRGYRFPPGIILGAALAAAIVFFFVKLKYETLPEKQDEQIELTEMALRAAEEDSSLVEGLPVDQGTTMDQEAFADEGNPIHQGAPADGSTPADQGVSADESILEGITEET